jgi:hypothetical protein
MSGQGIQNLMISMQKDFRILPKSLETVGFELVNRTARDLVDRSHGTDDPARILSKSILQWSSGR